VRKIREHMEVRGSVYIEQYRNGRRICALDFPNTIVNDGLAWLAGALSGDTVTPSDLKYIAIGTSTTAAAAAQTALVTEVETRGEGTQSRITTTVTSDTYQAVATLNITDTHAITECGIFSASTNGTMGARQTFAALNLISGDTLQITWRIKFA